MRLPHGSATVPIASGRRGHNLLEVVVAVTIFAAVVILFVGVWASYYQSQTLSRSRLTASALARSVLEQKIATGFNACVSDPAATTVQAICQVRGKQVDTELTYQFYAEDNVIPAIHPTEVAFRKLIVRVVWRDAAGGQKRLDYETHLYRTN